MTQFAIQRTSDRWWWQGESWTPSRDRALRFQSWKVAELQGLRDIPGDVKGWSVQPTLMTDFLAMAARDALYVFKTTASTKPKAEAPTQCCAQHAVAIESSATRSIWGCPVCLRQFSVPHPEASR